MAGEGAKPLPGRRPGVERAAGFARWRARADCENVFVQPAAGNAGTALGAVLRCLARRLPAEAGAPAANAVPRARAIAADEIKQVLENCKLRFHYLLTTDEMIETRGASSSTTTRSWRGCRAAWSSARARWATAAFWPRRWNPYSTENLNIFIKHREPFRKFAASVPAELCVGVFRGRPQRALSRHRGPRAAGASRDASQPPFWPTIWCASTPCDREENPLYWQLLHAAGEATGLPVLYNTSFNLFGEPLVCTPRDAVRSFYSSGIDAMFVGNFLLQK